MRTIDEACSGGVVHRRPLEHHGFFINSSMPSSVIAWYEREWRMLVRRLRYPGSSKARKARKRILRHWMIDALDQAEEEATHG